MNDTDLERFVEPVREHRDAAVHELTAGRKRTHWMWFMFPQLRGLGRSETAVHFGLVDVDEARRFLLHPELGSTYEHLVAIVHHLVVEQRRSLYDIFGSPDDVKLISSVTLFQAAAECEDRVQLAERCREIVEATQSPAAGERV